MRTRTFSWNDPLITAQAAMSAAGLDVLEAMARGELPAPPIAETLGFGGLEVGDGRAAFVLDPAEFHYNPIGTVHGGVICTLLDSALGCAVHSTLPAGARYTTLELKVNFVGAVTVGTGHVRAEAEVLHRGRRVATAEARLVAEDSGRLLAHATTTCLVM